MFVRGVDEGRGKDPDANTRLPQLGDGNSGDEVGSVQEDEFKKHAHFVGHLHRRSFHGEDGSDRPVKNIDGDEYYTNVMGGNETRPCNSYLYYIIKYKIVS